MEKIYIEEIINVITDTRHRWIMGMHFKDMPWTDETNDILDMISALYSNIRCFKNTISINAAIELKLTVYHFISIWPEYDDN